MSNIVGGHYVAADGKANFVPGEYNAIIPPLQLPPHHTALLNQHQSEAHARLMKFLETYTSPPP